MYGKYFYWIGTQMSSVVSDSRPSLVPYFVIHFMKTTIDIIDRNVRKYVGGSIISNMFQSLVVSGGYFVHQNDGPYDTVGGQSTTYIL